MFIYTYLYTYSYIYRYPQAKEEKRAGAYTAQDQPDWPDYATGDSSRRETKRQTEKTMGRQHHRVDWP